MLTRTVSTILLTLVFLSTSFARESTLLESGWRFTLGDPANAEKIEFKDLNWQTWETVSIPHCWGWEKAQQGKQYYQGPGWYRRGLNIGPPKMGRRYFLRFEAAGSVADIYLNGQLLGQHRGAFGAFCFEITDALSSTGTNLLAVRVSNAPQPDMAPLSGDFPVYGGLYRPVHLIETSDEAFALTDHGSPGVAWLQTSVTETQALLDVTAQISNGADKKQSLMFVASVLDASGNCVASSEEQIKSPTNMISPYHLHVVVPQPHLWNGRKDPYLYKAVVELRSVDDVLDSVEQPLGLRFYSIDPEKGFLLNGKPYPIRGVNRHQDRPNKGWAISEADQDEDIRLISEMGCTAIRGCHYQDSDYFYDLCDKTGILVWAELPLVNVVNDSAEFAETSRKQLLDLIRQNINHPSIFVWSLFNEINIGTADPHRLLQDLNNVAHSEDPTRPTIAATCTDRYPQMNKIPDLLGWNIYPGWYRNWGAKDDFGAVMDKFRDTSQHGGYCLSEFGAGANVEQHEQYPKQPKNDGPWHPEEWQALIHESAWAAIKARPYVWGTFIWNMFDFTSYFRHEGDSTGRNDKGLMTSDRKTRKDAFYFYKANWSDEPVLYITDRRFTERTNETTDVKIYSNASEVELLLNGISQGKRADATNCAYIWKNVQLQSGGNRIEARAEISRKSLSDGCVWTLKPVLQ